MRTSDGGIKNAGWTCLILLLCPIAEAQRLCQRAGVVRGAAHSADGRAKLGLITPPGRFAVEQARLELNAKAFTNPCFGPPDVDGMNHVLGRFRRDEGDFVETPLPV